MVRTRLFVVASPAGRKEPPHAAGRWPSASDGRWGFARFPQHARLRVSCGPGMPGPYASTMFYHAITAHVPGTVKTVPYKAPVDPDL